MMYFSRELPTLTWSRESAREAIASWERLIGPSDPLRCQAGVEVFREGDEARNVFLLAEGVVKIYCDLPNGSEGVLGLRFPGQVIEQRCHDPGTPYPISALTLVPSMIYKISAAELRRRQAHNPEISFLLERLLRVDLHNAAVFIM
jgi:CRP-like cAMP-binding protein